MKETKIAKQNIKEHDEYFEHMTLSKCESHKTTCQRWLDWFDEIYGLQLINEDWRGLTNHLLNKTNDLKQAIKLYGDNSI